MHRNSLSNASLHDRALHPLPDVKTTHYFRHLIASSNVKIR